MQTRKNTLTITTYSTCTVRERAYVCACVCSILQVPGKQTTYVVVRARVACVIVELTCVGIGWLVGWSGGSEHRQDFLSNRAGREADVEAAGGAAGLRLRVWVGTQPQPLR